MNQQFQTGKITNVIFELEKEAVQQPETGKITVNQLIEMLLWTAGGVLIFCIAFRKLILRKMGFTARLTFFMVLLTIYEIGYFYYTGLFRDFGCIYEWALFALAVVPLYFICLAIYGIYRKKKGALYTSALQKYQQERRTADD